MSDFVDQPEYTIPADSHHPAADFALQWFKDYVRNNTSKYLMIKEALYSTALSGNKLAGYCVGTIERMAANEPVSDRYILGLAWTIMEMAKQDEAHIASHIDGGKNDV